jgi:hypothetical protein
MGHPNRRDLLIAPVILVNFRASGEVRLLCKHLDFATCIIGSFSTALFIHVLLSEIINLVRITLLLLVPHPHHQLRNNIMDPNFKDLMVGSNNRFFSTRNAMEGKRLYV